MYWCTRYESLITSTGSIIWTLYCPEKRGLGLFDIHMHFADISGNERSDYLCIEKDGRAWGWFQTNGGTWGVYRLIQVRWRQRSCQPTLGRRRQRWKDRYDPHWQFKGDCPPSELLLQVVHGHAATISIMCHYHAIWQGLLYASNNGTLGGIQNINCLETCI